MTTKIVILQYLQRMWIFLLTPFAIVALPKCFLKEWRLLIRVFICLTFCFDHYHAALRCKTRYIADK